jgi:quercetin dioxygenase-like cupin family protein
MTNSAATDQLWFLNSLVEIRISGSEGQDSISVLEHHVHGGDSPPLHVHRTEDELFQILEGEFRVRVRDQEQRVGPGAILLAPKGVPHTYRAESAKGGRFLTVTARGDFENFVRALARPALRPELPPPSGPPSPEAMQALATVAGRFGIEFVGAPLE